MPFHTDARRITQPPEPLFENLTHPQTKLHGGTNQYEKTLEFPQISGR